MPGKEVTIAGKTWELKPLAGLKSIRLMPKVISVAAEILWAANDGGFPLAKLFGEEGLQELDLSAGLRAMKFVADTLGARYDEIALEVLPFLLQQQDKDWLWNHGNPREIIQAIWIAIKYHVETSFGEEVIGALKKLVAAEDEAAESEQDSK